MRAIDCRAVLRRGPRRTILRTRATADFISLSPSLSLCLRSNFTQQRARARAFIATYLQNLNAPTCGCCKSDVDPLELQIDDASAEDTFGTCRRISPARRGECRKCGNFGALTRVIPEVAAHADVIHCGSSASNAMLRTRCFETSVVRNPRVRFARADT